MNHKIYKKFFNQRKILVTGNTGFVGSYLSISLSLFGAKILGFSKIKKDRGYLSNQKKYKKQIKTIYGNVLNINNYEKKIKLFKPEIIIHLASQPIVLDAYKNTKETYLTNVLGTVELFELTKKLPSVRQILIFTSDKVYRNLSGKILNEDAGLGGLDPYSSSKSSQDIIANSYKESFFKNTKNVIILRAGNIIGGGDFEYSRLIPELFLSIKKKKKIVFRNPNAIRPWQHIFDVIDAMLLIICGTHKKLKNKSFIFNVGPNKNSNIKVISLVNMLKKIINFKYTFQNKNKFNETKILQLSNKKIKRKYNWGPKINISMALKLTEEWFKEYNENPKKIYDFSLDQIKNYFEFKKK
ncbi:CDP-glucose 4,6-dehydratase [Candidatus Pelagibacter sp.]|uniref:CDP-glucose 4,6-dehydratase n=1 Tax=Candidatus Pelagibacter sp. TaxID=2024849 RepID=UPI003F8358D9